MLLNSSYSEALYTTNSKPYLSDLMLVDFQYLFENGSTENIFSDHVYSKFSEVLTQTLRAFNPSCTASGESCLFS